MERALPAGIAGRIGSGDLAKAPKCSLVVQLLVFGPLLRRCSNRDVGQAVSDGMKEDDSGWCDKVAEVAFLIRGSRLRPTAAQLLVLTESELSSAEHKKWVRLSETFQKRAKQIPITLLKPKVQTIDDCRASTYRSSVPISIPSLRGQRDVAGPPI